jgi:hypothetical protein
MSDQIYDPLQEAINLRRRSRDLSPFERLAGTRAKLKALLMPPDVGTSTASPSTKEEMQTLRTELEKQTAVAEPEDLGAAIRSRNNAKG